MQTAIIQSIIDIHDNDVSFIDPAISRINNGSILKDLKHITNVKHYNNPRFEVLPIDVGDVIAYTDITNYISPTLPNISHNKFLYLSSAGGDMSLKIESTISANVIVIKCSTFSIAIDDVVEQNLTYSVGNATDPVLEIPITIYINVIS